MLLVLFSLATYPVHCCCGIALVASSMSDSLVSVAPKCGVEGNAYTSSLPAESAAARPGKGLLVGFSLARVPTGSLGGAVSHITDDMYRRFFVSY